MATSWRWPFKQISVSKCLECQYLARQCFVGMATPYHKGPLPSSLPRKRNQISSREADPAACFWHQRHEGHGPQPVVENCGLSGPLEARR